MARDIRKIRIEQGPISAHYELQEIIGEGAFGKVVLGEHILTKTKAAVKIIDQRVSKRIRRSLLHEVRCMEDLHHPNIVQLFHVISSPESLFLVMEFVPGGDMHHYLRAHGCMSEDTARGVFRQLVSAVHYCHEKGIAHRELKPQNVLLNSEINAKLADFGLGAFSNIHQLSTFCGSYLYAAPELFLGKIYDGCATDTWSLGVMLYQMLTDTVPFEDISWEELESSGSGQYDMPSHLSIEAHNLLKKLLTPKPEHRDNLKAIIPDPWLNMDQEEELKPYVEPPSDVIEPRVIEQMVTLGFHQEAIKDTLANNTYNNIMATYYILHRQNPKFAYRTIQVKPFHPPELQSCSPSPAQEGQPEWSGSRKAELQSANHKPGQKAQDSSGPSAILESSSTITEFRTTIRPSSTGAKTASPEPSWRPRNATPKLSTPQYCWGSRTATPEHRPGSRTATPMNSQGSRTATAEPNQGSGTATPEHRPGSRTATPKPRRGSRTANPANSQGSRTTTAEPNQGSRTATPKHRPGSRTAIPELTTIPSPAPQCHPGDTLSSHSTTSSSGNAEENKQGRRRAARRCLNIFRKIFCLPPKKGCCKWNQVKPL